MYPNVLYLPSATAVLLEAARNIVRYTTGDRNYLHHYPSGLSCHGVYNMLYPNVLYLSSVTAVLLEAARDIVRHTKGDRNYLHHYPPGLSCHGVYNVLSHYTKFHYTNYSANDKSESNNLLRVNVSDSKSTNYLISDIRMFFICLLRRRSYSKQHVTGFAVLQANAITCIIIPLDSVATARTTC
ncbi:hypothetical protein CDAR_8241 [Caerostris darwini]|uniref:Uncharacterized protein n=1 Tax=Caerostris darwini TaxID=1538125 RepID=A0AAV4MLA6_9ARAC|nr:hypothetical protein CDAR_8241 [Caerostris darwini]